VSFGVRHSICKPRDKGFGAFVLEEIRDMFRSRNIGGLPMALCWCCKRGEYIFRGYARCLFRKQRSRNSKGLERADGETWRHLKDHCDEEMKLRLS
jgi:hypothetical protein